MKKRLLTLVLATTMVMSMSISAFAATIDDAGDLADQEVVVGESTVKEPTVKITVPTSTSIILNPYKISFEQNGAIVNNQVVSVPQVIVNESDVPVAVSISSLKVTTDVAMLAAENGKAPTIAAEDNAKKAFVYFNIGKGSWDATAGAWTGKIATTYADASCTALTTTAAEVKDAIVLDAMKVTVKKTKTADGDAAKTKAVDPKTGNYVTVTIAADAQDVQWTTTTTETPSVAAYGFGGFLNNHTTAVWDEDDTISPQYKFTFALQSNK